MPTRQLIGLFVSREIKYLSFFCCCRYYYLFSPDHIGRSPNPISRPKYGPTQSVFGIVVETNKFSWFILGIQLPSSTWQFFFWIGTKPCKSNSFRLFLMFHLHCNKKPTAILRSSHSILRYLMFLPWDLRYWMIRSNSTKWSSLGFQDYQMILTCDLNMYNHQTKQTSKAINASHVTLRQKTLDTTKYESRF